MQISPTNLNLFSARQKTSINMNMHRRNAGFNYFLARVRVVFTKSFAHVMTERGKFNISAVFLLYTLKSVSWLKTKTNRESDKTK